MELIEYLPAWAKDLAVTYATARFYHQRRGSHQRQRLAAYRQLRTRSRQELRDYQDERFAELFRWAKRNSPYYARKYEDVDGPALERLPPLEKEELRANVDDIVIGDKKKLLSFYTGGTTGAAITLYLSRASLQDRIALLDLFWDQHGYHVGDRCAWFSGRRLLAERDRRRNVYWRTSWYVNVRYYSTFDMSVLTLPHYVANLNRFRPAFLCGFPSALMELARFMLDGGVTRSFQPTCIFTTSETLRREQRAVMEHAFGCKVRDQYSSTEGAPWIVECPEGRLHMDLATGIMEIVDEDGRPASEGEVLATSFTMRETPIIRYRIGDRVRLSAEDTCPCGWDTPLIDEILGRTTDYLEIPGRGKIWGTQIGDCVKGVRGIVKFQVELVGANLLRAHVVPAPEQYTEANQKLFLEHLRERVGDFPIEVVHVDDLPRSVGGKHSVIRRPGGTPPDRQNGSTA